MTDLTLTPNIEGPDDFYAELLAAHEGLSFEESNAFNARLLLILANHIGDRAVLARALEAAHRPTPETNT
ncbi:DUF2783 domain-containing protein [Roseovarius salinarum]|uniref:DUF2783 domain-containing protein n=1 Tax=Roseovarius salinarum TaxID=1981892 RepID=UPI0018E4D808|nr:DUF2783 domain-containing protein [Roseovarius salinarum]